MSFKHLRNIGAWLLLTVFVMMIVFTDFHRHTIVSYASDCSFCQHNQPHPKHFSQGYSYQDICLLCQLAGASFDVPTYPHIDTINTELAEFDCGCVAFHTSEYTKYHSDRAPPFYIIYNA